MKHLTLLACLSALLGAALAAGPTLKAVEGGYSSNILGAASPFGVRAQIADNAGRRLRINEVTLTGVTGDIRNANAANCALSINGQTVPAAVTLEGETIRFKPEGEVYLEDNKTIDAGCMDVAITGRSGNRRSFLTVHFDDKHKMSKAFQYMVVKEATIGGRARGENGLNFNPGTGELVSAARNFNVDVDGGRLQWKLENMDLSGATCTFNVGGGGGAPAAAAVPATVNAADGTVTVEGATVNADQPAELRCTGVKYKDGRGKKKARGTLRWVGGKDNKQTLAAQHATVCENKFCSAASYVGVSAAATGALTLAAAALSFVL